MLHPHMTESAVRKLAHCSKENRRSRINDPNQYRTDRQWDLPPYADSGSGSDIQIVHMGGSNENHRYRHQSAASSNSDTNSTRTVARKMESLRRDIVDRLVGLYKFAILRLKNPQVDPTFVQKFIVTELLDLQAAMRERDPQS